MSLNNIFVLLSPVLLATIIVYSIFNISKLSKTTGIFIFYVTGALFVEIFSRILLKSGRHNIFLLHILMPFQFLVLSWFYYEQTQQTGIKKIIKVVPFIVLPILVIQYSFKPELLKSHNPIGYVLTYLPIISYALFTIYNAIAKTEKSNYSLINIGVFLYFTASLLVFVSINILLSVDKNDFNKVYVFNNGVYVIFLILVLINLWKVSQYKKQI